MKANVIEKTIPFEFEGRTYNLKATYYVEAAIYDRYSGGLSEIFSSGNTLVSLLYVLSLLINEAVGFHNEKCSPEDRWEEIDDRYLGRHLTVQDAERVGKAIADVFTESRPGDEDEELTDEEKNGQTSRQK